MTTIPPPEVPAPTSERPDGPRPSKTPETLHNPALPLHVGTHSIVIEVPTCLEDFFDLHVMRNWSQLARFGRGFYTAMAERSDEYRNAQSGLSRVDEWNAYQCLHDTWRSIL